MPRLPERFRLTDQTPLADPKSQVSGKNYRITMLTERLLRFEWSPSGTFEDRPTQTVLHRDFEPVEFTLSRDGDAVQIITPSLQLNFDGQTPSSQGLTVHTHGSYHSEWRFGEVRHNRFFELTGFPDNLGGTARTLDAVDGPVELEDGVLSTVGIVPLDDSASLPLTEDGWVGEREPGAIDIYVFAHGMDFPGAIADFYRLTGPQPMLPRFALGNWWSRYHAYTQDEYQTLIERFEAERLPFSVAVIDMDWHLTEIDPEYGHGWTGYTWNRELFPDHVGFLAWLHDHGLKTSLNVHPADGVRGFEQCYPQVAEAMGIDPASKLPVNFDIADPDFVSAYFDLVHHPLEEEGVDFWWVDWQQGTHSSVPGLDPLWLLNHLHFIDSGRDGRRPMTFSRYAGPGSHRYPVGFSGDSVVSWNSLDFQPYFTSTASNIGYGWWSHDIGGHWMGIKDDELATRWVQFGVFSPINRLHSSDSQFMGKEPWRFNPIAERVQGEFLRLRHRMLPYLYTMNERAHSAAEPLCRPMYYGPRPEHRLFMDARNEYFFGTELVVAPITTPTDAETNLAPARAFLPEGVWIDIFTGVVYDATAPAPADAATTSAKAVGEPGGGRWMTLYRPIGGYPVLAKAGAIVPLTGADEYGVGNPESLEIRVYAGASGTFSLYEDDDAAAPRSVRTPIEFDWAAGRLRIEPAEGDLDVVPAERDITVVLVGAESTTVAGLEASYDDATGSLRVRLGRVATADGVQIVFEGPLVRYDNRVRERVFDYLSQAEIGIFDKEAIQSVIDRGASAVRTVSDLIQLGVAPSIIAPVIELVTAAG